MDYGEFVCVAIISRFTDDLKFEFLLSVFKKNYAIPNTVIMFI
jgi:hypothetical protein